MKGKSESEVAQSCPTLSDAVDCSLVSIIIMEKIYMCVCVCVGPQSCPTPCDPMDHNSPGSSVHEISQARILEPVAISYSRGSS